MVLDDKDGGFRLEYVGFEVAVVGLPNKVIEVVISFIGHQG